MTNLVHNGDVRTVCRLCFMCITKNVLGYYYDYIFCTVNLIHKIVDLHFHISIVVVHGICRSSLR